MFVLPKIISFSTVVYIEFAAAELGYSTYTVLTAGELAKRDLDLTYWGQFRQVVYRQGNYLSNMK